MPLKPRATPGKTTPRHTCKTGLVPASAATGTRGGRQCANRIIDIKLGLGGTAEGAC